MSHESSKHAIVDFMSKQSVPNKIVFKGIVYNEGSVAYQYMMDRYTPGNKMILWGCESESRFNNFHSYGQSISVEIDGTWISIFPGVIDNVGVLFAYPTSSKVDRTAVEEFFEVNFEDMFFVEHDINFLGKYDRKVEESKIYTHDKKKPYIEQVLVDSYTIFKNSKYQTVMDYIGNVYMGAVNNLLPYAENMINPERVKFQTFVQQTIIKNNAKYSLGTSNFLNRVINEIFNYLNTDTV